MTFCTCLPLQLYLGDFQTKAELIEANMASVHVPFFLDYKPFAKYQERVCIDGSFSDFLTGSNSHLLQCEGKAFVIDYSDDEVLNCTKMDFLRLREHDEVKELVNIGEGGCRVRKESAGHRRFRLKGVES